MADSLTMIPSLREKLSAGRFVATAEIVPPLSADPATLLARAAPLRGYADAINVTDGAGARVAMSSFAAAAILKAADFEPVLQVTCRDRNRIALAAGLLGAAAQGVENLLILHGDSPDGGDLPDAKPVYDLDSRGVMKLARDMRDAGALPSGRKIEPAPRFLIGGADSPLDPPADWRPTSLLAKAEAGADFIQTQFCFDLDLARRYLARLADFGLTERLKFLIGIGPIASARSARWIRDSLPGVSLPEGLIDRLDSAADPAAEGRRLCVELIEGLREIPGVAGVHLMAPLQKADAIAAVIAEAGLGPRR
ncbi:MAG: methylenetetrahydrofolate reductase [Kiloniellales bacterium]|nr:methylenetetrahydrofolate reductase [Kiloniellales bacterium]